MTGVRQLGIELPSWMWYNSCPKRRVCLEIVINLRSIYVVTIFLFRWIYAIKEFDLTVALDCHRFIFCKTLWIELSIFPIADTTSIERHWSFFTSWIPINYSKFLTTNLFYPELLVYKKSESILMI